MKKEMRARKLKKIKKGLSKLILNLLYFRLLFCAVDWIR